MASGVNQAGLLGHLRDHYFEWSGRYTGNALYAAYPVIFGLFAGYKFIPAVLLLALLFAMVFFLAALFKTSLGNRTLWLLSLYFVCVFLLGMVSTASSLFWMAGAFTYQTANILFLLILGLMIRLADRQLQTENYSRLTGVLLLTMVLAIGTNETSMLALTGIALAAVLMHLRAGWLTTKPWLSILMLALICFAVVYYSPGNEIRAADFPLRHDITRSIKGSLSVGLTVLWLWISNPLIVISSMLAPFAIVRLSRVSDRSFTVTRSHISYLVLITLMIPMLLQFPAWWAMGGWPPARTMDVIYFLFLVSWYASIGAVTLHFLNTGKLDAFGRQGGSIVAFILIVLALGFTVAIVKDRNFQLAVNDLRYLARPYHEYLMTRYQLIAHAKAKGEDYLIVPDYPRKLPPSIFFNDIMHNPNHWRNVCYADYFGLKKIKREKKSTGQDDPRH